MISYKQGDVVLIPFPFTDFSTLKQRPALVISSDTFNRRNEDIIIAAITSQIPKIILDTNYLLESSDLIAGGLPKTSVIKLGKIITIDPRLIRKRLGALPPSTLKNILSRLPQLFSSE